MNTSLSLKIETEKSESTADTLRRIFCEVDKLGKKENWPESLVYLVTLILEELGLNALTHGQDKGLDEFEINQISETDVLTIEMSDNGAPFNPLDYVSPPDLQAPLEARMVGGLGIHLIRSMVDDISYRREAGRNRLTLTTRRSE